MIPGRSTIRTAVVLFFAALPGAGCNLSGSTVTSSAAPIPDTDIGLAKSSVFDAPTPPAVKMNESAPGQQPPLPRPYRIAPPRIPHAIADFLPITRKENNCIGCHAVKEKKPGEATPIPSSHYTDYRHAPEQAGTRVVGARYVCIACHVETTGAPNLVDNNFHP
jgi:cytochrome c-type protein NapB